VNVLMTADTVGGVWTYAMELTRSLPDVRFTLATMGRRPSEGQRAEVPENVELIESSYRLEWQDDPWQDVDAAGDWLLALERETAADVVHLNGYSHGALPFRAHKLVVAHSCVLSWWRAVHGTAAPPEWDDYRNAVRQGLEGADLVVAPTAAMLGTLARNYGFRRGGIVIPNARSAQRFVPLTKEPFVLAAGRMWDAAKNIEALEAVAAKLRWPVKVAGSLQHPDGNIRQGHHVQTLGELTADALATELGRAAVYALPARYEPFGLSALEAALCGCALVLGDIASLREVWEDAALYVPADDLDALETTLGRLIADVSLRQRMAERAHSCALRYAPARMARHYVLAYERVLRVHARIARVSASIARERACAS